MLPQMPQALTRYSANDQKFPVNDRRAFTGCKCTESAVLQT